MALEVKDLSSVEVVHNLADIYFPDTETGRAEALRMFGDPKHVTEINYAFCSEWKADSSGRNCTHADPYHRGGYNKCRRCPAGYLHNVIAGMRQD